MNNALICLFVTNLLKEFGLFCLEDLDPVSFRFNGTLNELISYLVEQLPKLFILVDSEDVIAGEDTGASDTEDVVNVQHQVGDVTQGEQTKNNLFSWSGGSETRAID